MSDATLEGRPRVRSIQIGLPRSFGDEGAADPLDRPWSSGMLKQPIAGSVWLGCSGLEGDGQADRERHGGPEKAVLVYALAHYEAWRAELGVAELDAGAFGENFSVVGQNEADVAIGDVYAIGGARVQVSQPRQPCWKLARRFRIRDLPARVQRTGRTGWYLRVLEEGLVEAGCELRLLDRPFPAWSVAEANAVMHERRGDREAAAALADCGALAPGWRHTLTERAQRGVEPDEQRRLVGPNEL